MNRFCCIYIYYLFAVLPLIISSESNHHSYPSDLYIKTNSGDVIGTYLKNENSERVSRFWGGIKYATAKRFYPPIPVTAFYSILNASSFGDVCPQKSGHANWYAENMSEDCLNLNIWSPLSIIEPLPVLVFIHGGGFYMGSGSDPLYEARYLSSKANIIVVTFNYRIGPLGFLSHPSFTAKNPKKPTNFGLLDQRLAFQWIKKNIHNFGGNPNLITAAGQSAGACSLFFHLTDNSAAEYQLFNNIIFMSGLPAIPYPNLQEAEKNGIALAERLDCSSNESLETQFDCLSNLDVNSIVDSFHTLKETKWLHIDYKPGFFVSPTIDGESFSNHFFSFDFSSLYWIKSIILGFTKEEGNLFSFIFHFHFLSPSLEYFKDLLRIGFNNNSENIYKHYSEIKYSDLRNAFSDLYTDFYFICPGKKIFLIIIIGIRVLDNLSTHHIKVYGYLFDYNPDDVFIDIGVFHSVDLIYFFSSPHSRGNFLASQFNIYPKEFTLNESIFSDSLISLIHNFLYNQQPHEKWLPYNRDQYSNDSKLFYLSNSNNSFSILKNYKNDICNFWDSVVNSDFFILKSDGSYLITSTNKNLDPRPFFDYIFNVQLEKFLIKGYVIYFFGFTIIVFAYFISKCFTKQCDERKQKLKKKEY